MQDKIYKYIMYICMCVYIYTLECVSTWYSLHALPWGRLRAGATVSYIVYTGSIIYTFPIEGKCALQHKTTWRESWKYIMISIIEGLCVYINTYMRDTKSMRKCRGDLQAIHISHHHWTSYRWRSMLTAYLYGLYSFFFFFFRHFY